MWWGGAGAKCVCVCALPRPGYPPSSKPRGELTIAVSSRSAQAMWFGLTIVALWAVCSALWFMMPNASADIYDFLIVADDGELVQGRP